MWTFNLDGPDYLQRCVLPFSMWPFLITAWLGQGSSSTDISVAQLVRCLHKLRCWWYVFPFPGVLRSSLWDANGRDGSSMWLHVTSCWGIHKQSKYVGVLWLRTQSSGFSFSCPHRSVNSKRGGVLTPGTQMLHLATNTCITLIVKWEKVKAMPRMCRSWESKTFTWGFPDFWLLTKIIFLIL